MMFSGGMYQLHLEKANLNGILCMMFRCGVKDQLHLDTGGLHDRKVMFMDLIYLATKASTCHKSAKLIKILSLLQIAQSSQHYTHISATVRSDLLITFFMSISGTANLLFRQMSLIEIPSRLALLPRSIRPRRYQHVQDRLLDLSTGTLMRDRTATAPEGTRAAECTSRHRHRASGKKNRGVRRKSSCSGGFCPDR